MTKLFIGGFPLEMMEMELVQLVAPYADVITIKLVYDRASKKCKGYGFLEVLTGEAANNAIEALNGLIIGDRELTLNIVPEKAEARPAANYFKVERNPAPDRIKRSRRPRL